MGSGASSAEGGREAFAAAFTDLASADGDADAAAPGQDSLAAVRAEVSLARTTLRELAEARKAADPQLAKAIEQARVGGAEAAAAAGKKADYSKSFSGSAKDTAGEKDFGDMMRGDGAEGGGGDDASTAVVVRPCICIGNAEGSGGHAEDCTGTWARVVNMHTRCALYVHSYTYETVGLRPDTFVDVEAEAAALAAKNAVEAEDDGVARCTLAELPAVLEEIYARKKTPVVLDGDPDKRVRSFFTYTAIVFDARPMALGMMKTGIKMSDCIEDARSKLVGALKGGATFVVDVGDVLPNFTEKICTGKNRTFFPIELFHSGGKKMYEPKSKPRYEKVFREQDLDDGHPIVKPDFRSLILSSIEPKKYEEMMKPVLPFHHLEMVAISDEE